MRDILFRGKRIDNGVWVYGFYFKEAINNEDKQGFEYLSFIKAAYGDHYKDYEVDPKTVGQYIGEKDTKEQKIFEGDKYLNSWNSPAVVTWRTKAEREITGHGSSELVITSGFVLDYVPDGIEIIGNVYEANNA